MRRLRACAALLCLLAGLASAPAVAGGPSLWYVPGSQHHGVWLFGSIHLLKPGDFAFGGALARAYAHADTVVFEVDMGPGADARAAAAMRARATDPEGRSLDELLGPDAAEVHRLAAQLGIDLAPLAQREPWYAGLVVVATSLARAGYAAADGVEEQVEARAAADGKPVLGLETVDDELAALDSLTPAEQREFLLEALREAGRTGAEAARLLAAWKAGDQRALAGELTREFADSPALYRSLLVARNRRWLERLDTMLADGHDYLVVVGALHLVGPDGLPALLRARGHVVVRH